MYSLSSEGYLVVGEGQNSEQQNSNKNLKYVQFRFSTVHIGLTNSGCDIKAHYIW